MFVKVFLIMLGVANAQNLDFSKCSNDSLVLSQLGALNSCLSQFVNFSSLQNEIFEARKGWMDEVAQKYCDKYPEMSGCFWQSVPFFQSCLNLTQEQISEAGKYIDKLKNYFCYKDGNRIATFEGLDCLQIKKEELQSCFEVFAEKSDLANFAKSNDSCKHLMEIRYCVYDELSTCSQTIPANIIDAFFKFLKKEFSCVANRRDKRNTKDNTLTRIVFLIFYFIVAFFICYKLI